MIGKTLQRSMSALLLGLLAFEPAAGADSAKKKKGETVTRLFLQDHKARTLRWTDVVRDEKGQFSLGEWKPLEGFPALDPETQTLVQMRESQGRMLVGVRDKDNGKSASGWVLFSTGSRYREHGDHGHWDYAKEPYVLESRIDGQQGNPAHVYVYDGFFYVANDALNGFTQLNPEAWFRSVDGKITRGQAKFFEGGGNHITLAAIGNKAAFSTWIDGGGPNKGRVDAVDLGPNPQKGFSFQLPSGVIHGATACAGKVFFAPADGICWVPASFQQIATNPGSHVHHIPLGEEKKKPLRTGAFASAGDHVLFVTGQAKGSKLGILDATQENPQPTLLSLQGGEHHKPLTPEVVFHKEKKPMALVFHDHDPKEQADDLLEIFDLDPNGDGKWMDAKRIKVLKVGPSRVDGHYGHHSVAFDAEGLFAFFTNPGSGSMTVLDLTRAEIVADFQVGGNPTTILAHGSRETED